MRIKFPGRFPMQADAASFVLSGQASTLSYNPIATLLSYVQVSEEPVSGSRGGMSLTYANHSLRQKWYTSGGDYRDVNNALQGASPHGTVNLIAGAGGVGFVHISNPGMHTLVNRLLTNNTGIHIRGNTSNGRFHGRTGANPPYITVTTNAGVFTCPCTKSRWLNSGNNRVTDEFRASPSGSSVLKFDMSSVTGTVSAATLSMYQSASTVGSGASVQADYLEMPAVIDYPFVGTTASANVLDIEPTSFAQLSTYFLFGGYDEFYDGTNTAYAYETQYAMDPTNSMKFVTVGIVGTGGGSRGEPPHPRGIDWTHQLAAGVPTIYRSWAWRMHTDVTQYMNEAGVKMGGANRNESSVPSDGVISYRIEHFPRAEDNVGLIALGHYRFDVDMPSATINPLGDGATSSDPRWNGRPPILRAEQWYDLQVKAQMNSLDPPQADGQFIVKINGNLVHSETNETVRATEGVLWDRVDFELYHGGTEVPLQTIHYDVGRMRASTTDPGLCPEFVNSWPTWRQNITSDDPVPINQTQWTPATLQNKHNQGALNWSSPVITDDGRVVYTAAGGHDSDNSAYGNNGCFQLDLRQDSFAATGWTILKSGNTSTAFTPYTQAAATAFYGSTPRAHYAADIPGGHPVRVRPECHNYASDQYVRGAFCNDGIERVFNLGLGAARNPSGFTLDHQVDAFKLGGVNEWDDPVADATPLYYAGSGTTWGDVPQFPGSSFAAFATCADPRNGYVYYINNRNICRLIPSRTANHWERLMTQGSFPGVQWTQAPGSWTGVGGTVPSVIDVNRDRLVLIRRAGHSGQTNAHLDYFSLTATALTTTVVTEQLTNTGDGLPVLPSSEGIGMTHDLDNDRYIVYFRATGGDQVWSIDPNNANACVRLFVMPQTSPRGIFTGIRYVQSLGGVVMVLDKLTQNIAGPYPPIYFLRTRANP